MAHVLLSVGAGLAEALVILLVAAGASALVSGGGEVTVDVGPLRMALPFDGTLALGAAVSLLLVGMRLAGGGLAARMGSEVFRRTRENLVRQLLSTEWALQAKVTASRLHDLLSAQAVRMSTLVAKLAGAVSALVAFGAMIVTALFVAPTTALALLAVGAVLAVAFRPLTRRVNELSSQAVREQHAYLRYASNLFGVLPEIRIYGVHSETRGHHDRANDRVAALIGRTRFTASIQPSLYLGAVLLLLIGGLAIMRRQPSVDLAVIGATVLVLLRGLRYSQQAQTHWQNAVELLPYVEDYESVVASWPSTRHRWGSAALPHVESLELRGIQYTFPGGEPGLRGVDLTVQPAHILGLVGPSGAGKSTLAQVILGLRQPTLGTYLVNGEPHRTFDERSWFSRFAYVGQEPVLLDGSVRENVRFFRDVDDGVVDRALSDAAMDRDLAAWGDPTGARQVGSGGTEVSGGQRQRIAIARALVGGPDVLVLDEPTSALDPAAEETFLKTLERLRGQLTIIIIAHRQSTLQSCDVVAYLEDGRVVSTRPGTTVSPRHDEGVDASSTAADSP